METTKLQKSNKKVKRRGLFQILKNMRKERVTIDPNNRRKNAFMVLSQFNFHMINLGLSLEDASVVVLSVCNRVDLDAEKICVILAELQAN
jgi:uncharacterized membrane protein